MKKMNVANNAELANLVIDCLNGLYEAKRLINDVDDKNHSTIRLNYYANDVISAVEELNKQIRDEIHKANNYVDKDKGNIESSINYAGVIYEEPDIDEYGDI